MSNLSQPTFAAHESYITTNPVQPCNYVRQQRPDERCQFIAEVHQCEQNTYIISYMRFLFCYMDEQFALGIVAMCLWLMLLLVVVTTVSLKFYKPACLLLAKNLNMSPQLAGITILMFGNNASEAIVPAFRYQSDTEIVFAEIMGVAIFLVTFVCGLGIIIRPFLLIRSLAITTCLMHLTTAALIALSFLDDRMTIGEVFMYFFLYFIFLFAIFLGYAVLSKRSSALQRKVRPRLRPYFSGTRQNQKELKNMIFTSALEILVESGERFDVDQSRMCGFKGMHANHRLFEQFFSDLRLICFKNYEIASWPQKVRQIALFPVLLVLMLCLPMCDVFLPMHGWSKLRFIVNIFCYPLLVMTTVGLTLKTIADTMPLAGISLICSIVVATIVYSQTRTDQQPKYYTAICFMSYIGCIFLSFFIISEIGSALVTFSHVLNMSHTSIGLTVLAWANSLQDLIVNVSLTRSGYVRMAFAATFVGPFFAILFGMGVSYTILLIRNGTDRVKARIGANGPTILIYYTMSIIMFMLCIFLTNFQARKSIGYMLLIMYGCFLAYSILCELDLVHAYGTNHVDDELEDEN